MSVLFSWLLSVIDLGALSCSMSLWVMTNTAQVFFFLLLQVLWSIWIDLGFASWLIWSFYHFGPLDTSTFYCFWWCCNSGVHFGICKLHELWIRISSVIKVVLAQILLSSASASFWVSCAAVLHYFRQYKLLDHFLLLWIWQRCTCMALSDSGHQSWYLIILMVISSWTYICHGRYCH